MTDLPAEAVEAAAQVWYKHSPYSVPWIHLTDDERGGWREMIRQVLTAATPLIAAQATADLRAGIEALRDEWHKGAQGRFENGRHPGTLGSCADALDALLREGE